MSEGTCNLQEREGFREKQIVKEMRNAGTRIGDLSLSSCPCPHPGLARQSTPNKLSGHKKHLRVECLRAVGQPGVQR